MTRLSIKPIFPTAKRTIELLGEATDILAKLTNTYNCKCKTKMHILECVEFNHLVKLLSSENNTLSLGLCLSPIKQQKFIVTAFLAYLQLSGHTRLSRVPTSA